MLEENDMGNIVIPLSSVEHLKAVEKNDRKYSPYPNISCTYRVEFFHYCFQICGSCDLWELQGSISSNYDGYL
jgi:hypothetical protein